MKRKILIIILLCIMLGLSLILTGCGEKGGANNSDKYAKTIDNVKSMNGNEKIVQNANNTNRVSDEGKKYFIPEGYVLVWVKDKKIQGYTAESGAYIGGNTDYTYYFVQAKNIIYTGKSEVEFKNQKYNYKLGFDIKVSNIDKLFENKEVKELDSIEFYNEYIKNILENNVNRALVEKSEKDGKSVKEITARDVSSELSEILKKVNNDIGVEVRIDNITF